MNEKWTMEIKEKTEKHPCYSDGGHKYARMHIPVAPKCNIQCNYCNRKYDCLNESRPGVTSEVLTPEEAVEKYKTVKSKLNNLMVVGIAGPGDALANFQETKKSINLIKEYDPNVTFCLSTNGLMLPDYATEIKELGVTHVTVTINAIDPSIASKIYGTVSYKDKIYTGEKAGKLMIERQMEGLKALSTLNMVTKVNIVMIKGINDHHIESVVEKVKELGIFMTNIMPLIPAKGSKFEDFDLITNKELNTMRQKCSSHLKQMYHCRQCRADAIGILGEDISLDFRTNKCYPKLDEANIKAKEYTVAIASKTGRLIDQHFGHAEEFLIYKYSNNHIEFIEKRSISQYCSGVEDCDDKESKIENILNTLEYCDMVLCLRIGNGPRKNLESNHIEVIELYEEIEKGIIKAINKFKCAS